MVFHISPRTSVPLSALMVIFAALPPAGLLVSPADYRQMVDVSLNPVFTSSRNEEGILFFADRLKVAPIHYGFLHILPAIIWSIAMPLQYWDALRKSRPTLHRLGGYTAFTCSLILGISGVAFIPRRLSWSDPLWTMYRIHGVPVLPTFNTYIVLFAAPSLLFSLVRALHLARQKRFAEHRRWAVLHGIAGYIITLQRVWSIVVNILGYILASLPSLQGSLGIASPSQPGSMAAISAMERTAFAFTVWAAGLTGAAWALGLYRQDAIARKGSKVKTS